MIASTLRTGRFLGVTPQDFARSRMPAFALLVALQLLVVLPNAAVGGVVAGDTAFPLDLWGFLADWVFYLYALGYAAVVVGAGHQVDVSGPRRALGVGLVLYAVGAVAAGGAPSGWVFAAGVLVQGSGAGLLQVVVVALVAGTRTDPRRFARGIGVVAAVIVAGELVSTPVTDGIVAAFGWRWVFLLPGLAALATLVAARRLPSGHDSPRLQRLEGQTVWSVSIIVTCVLVAAVELPVRGWDVGSSGAVVVGAGLLIGAVPAARHVPGLRIVGTRDVGTGMVLWLLAGGALVAGRYAWGDALRREAGSFAAPTAYLVVAAVLAIAVGIGACPGPLRAGAARVLAAGGLVVTAAAIGTSQPLGLAMIAGLVAVGGAVAVVAGGLAAPLLLAPQARLGLVVGYLLAAKTLGQALFVVPLNVASGDGQEAFDTVAALLSAVGVGLALLAAAAAMTLRRPVPAR